MNSNEYKSRILAFISALKSFEYINILEDRDILDDFSMILKYYISPKVP